MEKFVNARDPNRKKRIQPSSLDKIELDIQSQVSRNMTNNDQTMKSMHLQT